MKQVSTWKSESGILYENEEQALWADFCYWSKRIKDFLDHAGVGVWC